MHLSQTSRQWLNYRPSRLRRMADLTGALYYVVLPKITGSGIDKTGILLALVRLFSAVTITLSPIWSQYIRTFLDSKEKVNNARMHEFAVWVSTLPKETWIGVGIIFIFQIYSLWFDKIHKKNIDRKEDMDARNELSISQAFIYGNIAQDISSIGLDKIYEEKTLLVQTHEMREQICACMLQELRILLDDIYGKYLEVTLVTYVRADGAAMHVDVRGDGRGRRTHRPEESAPSLEMFPHAAAYKQGYSVIHHFGAQSWFRHRSVTHPEREPAYESILCCPIVDDDGMGPIRVLGVVCVDSAKPFHFYWKSRKMTEIMAPYMGLMRPFVSVYPAFEMPREDLTIQE